VSRQPSGEDRIATPKGDPTAVTGQTIDLEGKRVWLAGHRGLVGSAIARRLESEPIAELITATSAELDLRDQHRTDEFVADAKPDIAIIAAARVGGIHANRSAQGQFLYDNLMISANTLEAARKAGVAKTMMLGSSCIYPRAAHQPIAEEELLTGPLEKTNEGYAIAKIAALEMAKMYRRQYGVNVISLMPTNLYGPNDNFDLETAHVLPALIRRFHEAKVNGVDKVTIWGTGTPRREFLHVDDMAEAVLCTLKIYDDDLHLNVGFGDDIAIADLATLVASIVGWGGVIAYDTSMPDGTPRKLLDVQRLQNLGWKPAISLEDGIRDTYEWFVEHERDARGVPTV
jgi:GDP-L-fucose synthase